MAEASKKNMALDRVPCIHYPVQFKKEELRALINSSSEINAITLTYVATLGLKVHSTNVGAQKIDGSTLETFGIISANF